MTTYTIQFSVVSQHISSDIPSMPVSDTKQYLRAQFQFDNTWNGLKRLGVFIGLRTGVSASAGAGVHAVYSVELDENDSCYFPAEVLSSEYTTIRVGVIGYSPDGQSRLTTDTFTVRQERSCFRPHTTPNPPTPDVYADMLAGVTEARGIADRAQALADELSQQAAAGAFNGRDGIDGVTPHIGENGNWYIGTNNTGVQAQGMSGMIPLVHTPWSASVNLIANHMTVIAPPLETDAGIYLLPYMYSLPEGYDLEWDFTLTQGEVAHTVSMPDIRWGLGIAPTFAANTTTVCRLYRVGNTLCGEWVSL